MMSPQEARCLKELAEAYPDDECSILTFAGITERSGLSAREVRPAIHELARLGYVRRAAIFGSDGRLAGSGYIATRLGLVASERGVARA